MNVLIINGGQQFAGQGGKINLNLTEWTQRFFFTKGDNVKITNINDNIEVPAEIEKFVWAEVVVYNIPLWWMYIPHKLKEYFDTVWMAGTGVIYKNDGRTRSDASKKYGTGGLMQGKRYLVNLTMNAPEEAFTDPAQLFEGRSTDESVMFPFHKMNEFVGFEKHLPGFNIYDVFKDTDIERFSRYESEYTQHLKNLFS